MRDLIYTIKHYTLCDDTAQYRVLWESLYQQSDCSVFLSWSWVQAWLDSITSKPIVLAAYENEDCVGLALLAQRNSPSLAGFKIKQLWLHRSGEPAIDQVWIEHNDFLVHRKNDKQIRSAMLAYLFEQKALCQELYFGLTNSAVINALTLKWPHYREVINSPDFEVNLRDKTHLDDYLADLSKNTRSQIRRTEKILTQSGDLTLTLAQGNSQKKQFLDDISQLHKEKWRDTEFGSGFDNPAFERFHHHLVFEKQETNKTRIYCLCHNTQPMAYIYILLDENTWYFYLSAIKSHADNRVKVGLLAHAYIIQAAISEGITRYSFLAGEARYKRSLSNQSETNQKLICFYQPTLFMRTREFMRRSKSTLKTLLRH
jgi:CelD/BcsL family acetyltransferase involved in cellulose biosynthesis